ncbi:hypothetical protein [Sulfobacillus sp. hq2]|uniref:hypothetical protein n=1 Tax=Sulfobacillus sp. hq2 TaxID=2039167 RepID=UPI000CD040B8|nr:hypothetical protein [Sulfobacillus sp. hq2]POB12166.1 hypothetical protein CO251_00640 [Sulfobacillus sp. hq2]
MSLRMRSWLAMTSGTIVVLAVVYALAIWAVQRYMTAQPVPPLAALGGHPLYFIAGGVLATVNVLPLMLPYAPTARRRAAYDAARAAFLREHADAFRDPDVE